MRGLKPAQTAAKAAEIAADSSSECSCALSHCGSTGVNPVSPPFVVERATRKAAKRRSRGSPVENVNRARQKKARPTFPTGSGLTPVLSDCKERTNMSKITGVNHDVNEELQQVTDPVQPDDHEFEAWLDSLNERTANGGADRPSRSIFTRLLFRWQHGYSIDKIGFLTREEQIKEMRRLDATAHKRQAAQLRYQRRQAWLHQGSLIGVLCINLTIVLFYGGLIVYSFFHPAPVIAQQVSSGSPDRKFHSKLCPTLDGKPFCDLSENDKALLGKKVKHVKASCTDTGKMDGPEGCEPPSFFQGDGRESLLTETDLDGKPIYTVCHAVYKCKALR
jgi:hypothetical protein